MFLEWSWAVLIQFLNDLADAYRIDKIHPSHKWVFCLVSKLQLDKRTNPRMLKCMCYRCYILTVALKIDCLDLYCTLM